MNPLGLVYLTNMAPAGAGHSATTMFHAWFAHGTRWQQVTEQLPGPTTGLATNLIERPDDEIERSGMVGIFPKGGRHRSPHRSDRARTERRMGHPTCPLHDAGNYRAVER
jgi:hypothetical protein